MLDFKLSKMMRDLQWSFVSLVTSSVAHLALRIVLGKDLGPSGLGIYTLVFTIYMLGMQFSGFGIGAALIKYVAEFHDDAEKIKEYVSSGLLCSIIFGSLMSTLLYLSSSMISVNLFHLPEMIGLLKLTAFCFPFIAIQKISIGTLNGLRRLKIYALINIVMSISILVSSVVLVSMLNMGVQGAVIGLVVPTIFVGLLSLVSIKGHYNISLFAINNIFKDLLSFGFYVVLANSIDLISTQIDSLMIGYFLNETEVGFYAVAVIFMSGITLIPKSIQTVTTPAIARHYKIKDFESISFLLKRTMFKTFIITISIALILALFGKTLIGLIFTEDFIPAYIPMLILLIGYSIYASSSAVGGCLSSIGKVQILFKISIICAGLNTVLNFILIPRWGIIGAASATSISLVFTTLINLYYIRAFIHKESLLGAS